MFISGGLTVLSAVLALLARRPSCTLAALAMAVSSLGDAVLAGYPSCFGRVRDRLPKGGLIFWIAHLLYIRALVIASGGDASALLPRFALPCAFFLGLTVLHGLLFAKKRDGFPASRMLFVAAFLYLGTVGIHAAAAIAVSLHTGGGFLLNIAGSLLFYLSDAILLARKYGAVRGHWTTALIWLTYVPAQLCLLLGFYLA